MPSGRSRRRAFGGLEFRFGSLSLSVFVWVFAVIIAAFAAFAVISVRTTSQRWHQSVELWAERFSDLIKESTHYAMLLNRKEDVHHTIQAIAREPGVEGVRIYDKQGTIIFSAKSVEIGREVDLQAEACVICHEGGSPLQAVPASSRARVFRGSDGHRVLGLINPIENAPECYSAPCHAHPEEQTILGVLDVKMSMEEADAGLAATRRQIVTAGVLTALLVGIFSALLILRLVRRPVKQLISGTERVANGDLGTEIRVDTRNEMGQLADAFNRMTRDLERARQELTEWSGKLETRLMEKTAELSQTQRQVAHMEKMASLGKLAATVAHELNNPLAGILNYAKLVDRTLREGEERPKEEREVGRYLSLIQKEAGRCGDIVRNLLLFARRSGAELALHRLNTIVERAVMLVRHHLEMSDIHLEKHLVDDDLDLVCDADQLQQALVALMVNAVEAMPSGGTLRVRATSLGDTVGLTVADTGVGIPAEAQQRIFEPFYSSKENKDGAGLGLAVVYGIVQRHQGRIEVESQVGKGTTFRITLPRRPATGEAEGRSDTGPEQEEDRDGSPSLTATGRRQRG